MDSVVPPAQKRRSRMRRTSTGKRIELQPRDFEIFRLLYRYRYLRSTHIHRFVDGDRTKLIERLGTLYHEGGYLDRPEQQWNELGARFRPVVYEITDRVKELLREHDCGTLPEPVASFGNGRQFRHALMVCEVLVHIELAARERRVRFIPWNEIRAKRPTAEPVPQIPVSISCPFDGGRFERSEMLLTPDAVFGLEYSANGARSYRFFALEADRGTMPVVRATLTQSSYLKKLIAYRQIIAQGLHRSAWGLPNLLVLNAVQNAHRVRTIIDTARNLSQNQGITWLLFSVLPTTGNEPSTLWQRYGHSPLDILVP